MSKFLKMFYLAVMLDLCFMAVSQAGIVKLTLANNNLIEGSPANLTCTTNPYQGQMYWKVDNDIVAECVTSHCTNLSTGLGTYSFVFNVTDGTFGFTINPVSKDLDGQVIKCTDGVSSDNATLEVQEVPGSVSSQRSHVELIVVLTALILGVLAVSF